MTRAAAWQEDLPARRRGAIPVHVRFRTVEGTSVRRQPAPFAGRRSAADLRSATRFGRKLQLRTGAADDKRCPEGRSRGT